MMTDERIVKGFQRPDLQVVHSKDELVTLLNGLDRTNMVGGFMSSGDFNGLTTEDLKKLF